MFKILRVVALLMFIILLIAPLPAHAAPITCNQALYEAGLDTALLGVQLSGGNPIHWQFIDLPYTVDYIYVGGGLGIATLEIHRGARLVGQATVIKSNPVVWSVCRGGNGWKNYLLGNTKA